MLGAGAAAAVVRPALSFAEAATGAFPPATAASEMVRLSANENPYGPSPKALRAMSAAYDRACRYPDESADALAGSLARLHGVGREQILLGDGSSEILKLCADEFSGPLPKEKGKTAGGRLVLADPTFEAILYHATMNHAAIEKVPLTASYGHDLPKMMAAAEKGLIYVCNPNNPTASTTPKKELRDFIEHAPNDSIILVDEAYYHYADSPDYESVIPLVKDHVNLIVTRTFSKIYGMAGLRCGYAVAQGNTIERLRERQSWDSSNVMALVAAAASLEDPEQVAKNRRLNNETRAFTTNQLAKIGYPSIASQANFIMFDAKRPVVPLIASLKQKKVQVGRLFRALPNHLRLTIGTRAEMETFLKAFQEVIG